MYNKIYLSLKKQIIEIMTRDIDADPALLDYLKRLLERLNERYSNNESLDEFMQIVDCWK